jgi:hypothetical protein
VGAIDNSFVFKIPVYENMPQNASPRPTAYGVTLTPPTEYVSMYKQNPTLFAIWVDGIEYPAYWNTLGEAQIYLPNEEESKMAKTAVLYQYNENGISVGMNVWTLSYGTDVFESHELTELKDLLTYHGFSIRITGNSGIRVKTGISAQLRNTLLTDGVEGYQLKEYGTLVMNESSRPDYPFVKDGAKVRSALSYGMTDDGLRDAVFETVAGRYRYTVVFVNLPVSEYKTVFAFRGYMVLTNGVEEIVLYGPINSRSIYRIAEQVNEQNVYEQGTPQDLYIQGLISASDEYDQTLE